jgi:hypothetical protein
MCLKTHVPVHSAGACMSAAHVGRACDRSTGAALKNCTVHHTPYAHGILCCCAVGVRRCRPSAAGNLIHQRHVHHVMPQLEPIRVRPRSPKPNGTAITITCDLEASLMNTVQWRSCGLCVRWASSGTRESAVVHSPADFLSVELLTVTDTLPGRPHYSAGMGRNVALRLLALPAVRTCYAPGPCRRPRTPHQVQQTGINLFVCNHLGLFCCNVRASFGSMPEMFANALFGLRRDHSTRTAANSDHKRQETPILKALASLSVLLSTSRDCSTQAAHLPRRPRGHAKHDSWCSLPHTTNAVHVETPHGKRP